MLKLRPNSLLTRPPVQAVGGQEEGLSLRGRGYQLLVVRFHILQYGHHIYHNNKKNIYRITLVASRNKQLCKKVVSSPKVWKEKQNEKNEVMCCVGFFLLFFVLFF